MAGDYLAEDGRQVKVAPLTDEDRRALARWVDLGCPIDFDPSLDAGKLTVSIRDRQGNLSRIVRTLSIGSRK